jgi:polysaccharide pyruvyl transferase WcaK-like protein
VNEATISIKIEYGEKINTLQESLALSTTITNDLEIKIDDLENHYKSEINEKQQELITHNETSQSEYHKLKQEFLDRFKKLEESHSEKIS